MKRKTSDEIIREILNFVGDNVINCVSFINLDDEENDSLYYKFDFEWYIEYTKQIYSEEILRKVINEYAAITVANWFVEMYDSIDIEEPYYEFVKVKDYRKGHLEIYVKE